MNAVDVLRYGHQTVVQIVDQLPEDSWHAGGVCGVWSVKDIIAHLASFEQALVDVLHQVLGHDAPTPTLAAMQADFAGFNDSQVEQRRALTVGEVWAEYEAAHAQTVALLAQVPVAQRRQNGLLAWYGPEYDLDDFIAYSFYGHKREHAAQVAVYRDRLQAEAGRSNS